MDLFTLTAMVLLALLVLLTGVEAIPIFVFFFRPGAMRLSFDDALAGNERIAKSPVLQEWLIRLQDLGFVLMGVKVERLPLWGRAYREAALVSLSDETYASIVLHPNGRPVSLYFYTPFQDGGMVFTRNFSFAPQMETERISVRNIPGDDFKAALASHVSRVGAFKEKGLTPLAGQSPQARIEATQAFYASEYSRRHGHYLLSPSTLGFGVLLLLALYAVYRFAFTMR
jgi:hypothetical protein